MSVPRLGRALAVPMIALVAAALAACGSADASAGVATANGAGTAQPSTSASPSADREEALRQFAACMRQHGVDVPDPQPGGGGFALGGQGQNRDNPNFRTAFEACRSMLPNGGQPPKLNAQQIEAYRQFAQCMRDNGVDVPDPNPDGTLQFGQGRGPGQVDRNNATFQKALTACRDKLTGVFPSGGPGFRGGNG
jgi:hypothetical protein